MQAKKIRGEGPVIFVVILFGLGVLAIYMGCRIGTGKTKVSGTQKAYMKISLPVLGIHTMACSLMGGVCLYFENDFGLVYSICVWMGVGAVGLGILQVCKIYLCTQQISATCIDYQATGGSGGGRMHSPYLGYIVAHEHYLQTTDESYLTEKKMKEHYKKGEKYQIWIYPKYPNWFVTDKKIHARSIIWIIIGLLILIGPLYYK